MSDSQTLATYSVTNTSGEQTVTLQVNNNLSSDPNTIILPGSEFTYGSMSDNSDVQYLVTSDSQPLQISETNDEANLVLKYIREGNSGKIDWVKDLETLGNFPNKISDTISRTLPLGDFFTDIQTNVDNFNSSTNNQQSDGESADTKYKWVNLSATVIDIGLNQLAWNSNKQYYFNENQGNSTLNIKCSNILDEDLGLKINYITYESSGDYVEQQPAYYSSISAYNENKLECYKVNSVELIPTNERTYNANDIEFYFTPVSNSNSTNFQNGISSLNIHDPDSSDSCFTYNCDYLNCQYYNMYYNRGATMKLQRSTLQITDSYNSAPGMDLSFIDKYIEGNPDGGESEGGTVYELEGGRGRKAELKIINNSDGITNNQLQIKLNNKGYLYQAGDLLRFKDRLLKNEVFFTVAETESGVSNLGDTKFTQEYIKAHHGKSNTLKYALDSSNCLLIKELNISGSTNSKILVRLIEVCKPIKHTKDNDLRYPLTTETQVRNNDDKFSDKNKNFQRVLREFYYFNRNNINDTHHINKLIKPESEIFVDIQKLLENNDSDDKLDTLTLTLNGIKIKLSESGSIQEGLIMERKV